MLRNNNNNNNNYFFVGDSAVSKLKHQEMDYIKRNRIIIIIIDIVLFSVHISYKNRLMHMH
jgi:hypothetical protein